MPVMGKTTVDIDTDGWWEYLVQRADYDLEISFIQGDMSSAPEHMRSRTFSQDPFPCHYLYDAAAEKNPKIMHVKSLGIFIPEDFSLDNIIDRILNIQVQHTKDGPEVSDIKDRAKKRFDNLIASMDIFKTYSVESQRKKIMTFKGKNSEAVFFSALTHHIIKPLLCVTDQCILNTSSKVGNAGAQQQKKCVLCQGGPCEKIPGESETYSNLYLGSPYLAHGIPDGVIGLSKNSHLEHAVRKLSRTEPPVVTYLLKTQSNMSIETTLDDSMSIEDDLDSDVSHDLLDQVSFLEAKKKCPRDEGVKLSSDLDQLITTVVIGSLYNEKRKQFDTLHQGLLVSPIGYRFVWYIATKDLLVVSNHVIEWRDQFSLFTLWLLLNRRYLLDCQAILKKLDSFTRTSENEKMNFSFGFKEYKEKVLSMKDMDSVFEKFSWHNDLVSWLTEKRAAVDSVHVPVKFGRFYGPESK